MPDPLGPSPSLAELQAAFQCAVVEGDDAILELVPANSRTGAETLLGVYRHAFVARLVDIAAADYPRLVAYMGADTFARMARGYLAAHPSRSPNARWFGSALPEHLAHAEPWSRHGELAELAALERAMNDAFDAADEEAATLQALLEVAPEQWAGLTFAARSPVRRLDLATNAFDIWSALKTDSEPPAAASGPSPRRVVVWRSEATARVRELEPEEAMLWDEAAKGVPFGALCELAAVFDDPDGAPLRVAQALRGWLEAGMLARGPFSPPAGSAMVPPQRSRSSAG